MLNLLEGYNREVNVDRLRQSAVLVRSGGQEVQISLTDCVQAMQEKRISVMLGPKNVRLDYLIPDLLTMEAVKIWGATTEEFLASGAFGKGATLD